MSTAEQQARDLLERMGYDDAQSLTAGDVVELANIIAENSQLKMRLSRMNASDIHVFNQYEDELSEMRQEIWLTEQIANNYRSVLQAVPECNVHGECVPHAIEWIEKAKKAQRYNELLQEVAKAAKTVGNKAVLFPGYYTVSFQYGDKLLKSVQAAISGGALEAS